MATSSYSPPHQHLQIPIIKYGAPGDVWSPVRKQQPRALRHGEEGRNAGQPRAVRGHLPPLGRGLRADAMLPAVTRGGGPTEACLSCRCTRPKPGRRLPTQIWRARAPAVRQQPGFRLAKERAPKPCAAAGSPSRRSISNHLIKANKQASL